MTSNNKQLTRLAAAIHSRLVGQRDQDAQLELPMQSWEACTELVRQIRRAQLHGWHLAVDSLRSDLRHTIPTVENQLAQIRERLPRPASLPRLGTVSEIYRDLVALEEEFETLDYDIGKQSLSVTTESIELEGVSLGPFEIRLDWRRIYDDDRPYRAIAKDPHPACSRDNVTHPHVSDELVCEGEGRHAIRQALGQGRLYDFFSLIAAVLRNYNPESPYVELALWGGQTCSDCGELVREDDGYCCQKCGDLICEDCEVRCGDCGESYCCACTCACAVCEERYCSRCLKNCADCQRKVCGSCRDADERCTDCHEEDSEDERLETSTAPTSGAAVQSNGLGQTTISA